MGSFSNNEVGSRILSLLSAEITGRFSSEHGVGHLLQFLPNMETAICERLLQVAEAVSPEGQRDLFLKSFFMSTMLVFAIDSQSFAVFGCGDGFYAINGKIESLDDFEGTYLTGRLSGNKDWQSRISSGDLGIRLHQTGETSLLQSLLIGTDGFEEVPARFQSAFAALTIPQAANTNKPGFWPAMAAEYRSRFWQTREVREWADVQDSHDDRTFLLVRRLSPDRKEVSSPCSVSQETTSQSAADSSLPLAT
jgi:hypothetical protein